MIQKLLMMIITASLIFTMTGCPKKTNIEKAASASYQLSGLILDLTKATTRAYDEKLISTGMAQASSGLLRKMNEGAKQLTSITAEMAKLEGKPDASKLDLFSRIFSNEVVTPFLNMLNRLGVVAADKASYLSTAISALRIAILTIAGALAQTGYAVDTGGLNNV